MRLTSKGRYAVRAVLDLTFHSHGRPVRLQEISERQRISLHYLEQLFRRLRKGEVVKSVRGPGGGYILARSMDEISIKDILMSVGENINPARDLVGVEDAEFLTQGSGAVLGAPSVAEGADTLEFLLTKGYFENLGLLMQDYLTTTSVGQLVRRSRGMTLTPRGAGVTTSGAGAVAGAWAQPESQVARMSEVAPIQTGQAADEALERILPEETPGVGAEPSSRSH